MTAVRWTALGPILIFALALRLAWAIFIPVDPISDSYIYHIFAREIAAGHGYVFPAGHPTVYWPVGPSALYGALYAVFGVHDAVIVVINLIMGCGIVAGLYRLGTRHFGVRVGAIAAIIAALWPAWIQFVTVPSSELPFALLMILALLARGEPSLPALARTALSTALLVAAAFMRPTILPLVLLFPLLDQPLRRPARTALNLCVALLVAAALLTPWAERNRNQFGQHVLISANFGANLWMGNNPASYGGYMKLPPIDTPNEVTRDAYFKQQAVDFIRANPGEYLRLCIKRIRLSFDRETVGVSWNQLSLPSAVKMPLKAISSAYWLIIFGLSLAGVTLFLWEKPVRIFDPLVVAPALFAAVAILVVGQDRYHMPMMPFVALFAALAINRILDRRRPAPDRRTIDGSDPA